jgi:type IX secretion system PorP/SprF family membrane protein
MKKHIVLLLLIVGYISKAQQDPLFSQYMFNKLLINPAYAGSREMLSVDILNRLQWTGIEGAPRTFTLAAHMPLRNRKIGIGLHAYRDALGPTINQGMMATYAYRLINMDRIFSFGLQGGIKHLGFDWNAIRLKQQDDPLFYPQEGIQRFAPDINFGMYYQTPKFFAGLSSKQLLENEYGQVTDKDGRTTFSRLLRHFYLMTGTILPLNDRITFRPSALAKYVKNAPPQLDVNASLVFNDIFWIGASYRTQKALVLMTEIQIIKNTWLGYSFDIWFNELQPHNYGSHEFRLAFDIDLGKSRMKTPRFF